METVKSTNLLHPYTTRLVTYITSNPEKVVKDINRQFKETFEWAPDIKAITFNAKKTVRGHEKNYVVVVFTPDTCVPDIVAHEAVHVANFTFMHAGVDLDTENDEPQAYMVGRIVELIYKVIKKYDNKKQVIPTSTIFDRVPPVFDRLSGDTGKAIE